MKILVLLLLVGNLAFYAFSSGLLGQREAPESMRLAQQVSPERIVIVGNGEAPAAGKPVRVSGEQEKAAGDAPSAEMPAADAKVDSKPPEGKVAEEGKVSAGDGEMLCVAWDRLSVAEAERLQALLIGRYADFKLSRKALNGDPNAWWVYIPPLADKSEADKKAGELRLFGVTDFFVIQEGPNRFAISLGVFSAEKGAQERLTELKGKGVRSARMGPRPGKDGYFTAEVSGPASLRTPFLALVSKVQPKPETRACQ